MNACSVMGCTRTHWGHGYCQAHYTRVRRQGDPQSHVPVQTKMANGEQCSAPRCDKKPHALTLCKGHHSRLKRWGNVRPEVRIAPSRVLDPCTVPDCSARHYAKGYCRLHWRRVSETGQADLTVRAPQPKCRVPICGRTARAGGYCGTHYERLRRRGSALGDQPIKTRRSGLCRLDNCPRPHYCLGYCLSHYQQRVGHPRRRALERLAMGLVTAEQLQARIAYYGYRCWMCRAPWTCIDHVKPLAVGGCNWPANLRPACRSCNARKCHIWPYPTTTSTKAA